MVRMENSVNLMIKLQNLMFRDMQNFLLSPFAIEILSYGFMSGSGGRSFNELSRLLIGQEIKPEELNDVLRYYKSTLNKFHSLDPQCCEFIFINFIYVSNKFEVTNKYQEYVDVCLEIKTRPVDFENDTIEVLTQIDKEIKDATTNKIESPLGCYPTVSRLLAINCTQFQSLPKYIPHSKYNGVFQNQAGDNIPAEYTVQNGQFRVLSVEEYNWIEMPYKNDSFTLCILIPKGGRHTRSILEKLNYNELCKIITNSTEITAELHMPIIRLVWNFDIAVQLQLAGMQKIFEKDAEFTRMAKNYKNLHCESVMMNLDFNFMKLNIANIPVNKDDKSKKNTIKSLLVNSPFLFYLTFGKQERMTLLSGVVNGIEF